MVFLAAVLAGGTAPYDASSPSEDHTARAKQFSADGDDDMATIAFRAAVRFEPESVARRQNLAVSLMRQGELEASRRAFGDAFALARRLQKPIRSVRRNLNFLKEEWKKDFNELMDPIQGEEGDVTRGSEESILYRQRLEDTPLHILAERDHLDSDTAGRGIEGGLERRLSR